MVVLKVLIYAMLYMSIICFTVELIQLSSLGPGPGPRSGPGQVPGQVQKVPGQVQKVQGLRTKDLDLG